MKKNSILTTLVFSLFVGTCLGVNPPPNKTASKSEPLKEEVHSFYQSPGVITNRNGEWIGSDHLLNLSNQIEVVVEIVKPKNADVSFGSQQLEKLIKEKFSAAGLNPSADIAKNKGPLPMFHVLLMIFPSADQVVGFISCRIFESVTVGRVQIDPSTVFQAITWENQNMIIASKKDFQAELVKDIDSQIKTFLERYQYFQTR